MGLGTNKFPEFFTSDSGYEVSTRFDSEEEIAKMIKISFEDLKLRNGILVTVPIPKENVL